MTFPLPPNEAVILAELQRLLDARIVEPSPFQIPVRALDELREHADQLTIQEEAA